MVKKKSIKIDSPPPSLNWRLQFSPGIIIQDRHDLMFFVISFIPSSWLLPVNAAEEGGLVKLLILLLGIWGVNHLEKKTQPQPCVESK